eukprot:GABU01009015.1.p1 GENE.GABU01009015.1~~GABU01009015.1.p1  ORF type:complete len:144 (+),score=11.72 GABU01009015.1:151-582(+)
MSFLKSGYATKHDLKMDEDDHTAAILQAIQSAKSLLPEATVSFARKDSIDRMSTKLSSESSNHGRELQYVPQAGSWHKNTNTTFRISLNEPRGFRIAPVPLEDLVFGNPARQTESTLGWLASIPSKLAEISRSAKINSLLFCG